MAVGVQVCFDASDPARLGAFWAELLGYVEQPPPEGFGSWQEALTAWGCRGPAGQRLRHRRPRRGRPPPVLPAGARGQGGQEPRAPRRRRRRRAASRRTRHTSAPRPRGGHARSHVSAVRWSSAESSGWCSRTPTATSSASSERRATRERGSASPGPPCWRTACPCRGRGGAEPWEGDVVAKVADKIFAFLGSGRSVGVKCGANRDEANEWFHRYPRRPGHGLYRPLGVEHPRPDGAIPDEEIFDGIHGSYARRGQAAQEQASGSRQLGSGGVG